MIHFKIGCNQMTIMQFVISLSKPKQIGGIVFQLWICIIRVGIYGHKSVGSGSGPNMKTTRRLLAKTVKRRIRLDQSKTRRSVDPSIRETKLTVRKIPIYIILMLRPVSGRFLNLCSIFDWLSEFERNIWKLSVVAVCKAPITAQVYIIDMIFEVPNDTFR